MKRLLVFRPGLAANGTAFEAQLLIYRWLQQQHGWQFTLVRSEDDRFTSSTFEVVALPREAYRSVAGLPLVGPLARRRFLEPLFAGADGVVTVDPTIYAQGLLAIGAAQGKPVFFDTSVTNLGTKRGLVWQAKRALVSPSVRQAAGIVATVPKCLERFRDIGLFDEAIAEKFVVMGHPVDGERFRPPARTEEAGPVRVVVVSRLLPEKGLHYVLEAMQPLLRAGSAELQIVGAGPLRGLLQREVRERGVADRVEFLPPVPHERLPALLGAADLFVNHAAGNSVWEEYFGALNVEAMACGLPCVVSSDGGIPWVIREKGVALLVQSRDVAGLRQALSLLVRSPERRRRMGERARAYALQHYGLDVVGERYHRMLLRGFGITEPAPEV